MVCRLSFHGVAYSDSRQHGRCLFGDVAINVLIGRERLESVILMIGEG